MLVLPIKKIWYDMTLSGEKKEEYREIKSYYVNRFAAAFGYIKCAGFTADKEKFLNDLKAGNSMCKTSILVIFRNGYGKSVPFFTARVTVSIGTGKEEWGADKDKQYFILTILKILEIK